MVLMLTRKDLLWVQDDLMLEVFGVIIMPVGGQEAIFLNTYITLQTETDWNQQEYMLFYNDIKYVNVFVSFRDFKRSMY